MVIYDNYFSYRYYNLIIFHIYKDMEDVMMISATEYRFSINGIDYNLTFEDISYNDEISIYSPDFNLYGVKSHRRINKLDLSGIFSLLRTVHGIIDRFVSDYVIDYLVITAHTEPGENLIANMDSIRGKLYSRYSTRHELSGYNKFIGRDEIIFIRDNVYNIMLPFMKLFNKLLPYLDRHKVIGVRDYRHLTDYLGNYRRGNDGYIVGTIPIKRDVIFYIRWYEDEYEIKLYIGGKLVGRYDDIDDIAIPKDLRSHGIYEQLSTYIDYLEI